MSGNEDRSFSHFDARDNGRKHIEIGGGKNLHLGLDNRESGIEDGY